MTNEETQVAPISAGDIAGAQDAATWREQLTPFDLENVTVGGTKQLTPFDGRIIAVQTRRAFYPDRNATEGTPPTCSSPDGLVGAGNPGGECAKCPLSQFGSSADTRASACKEFRFLYMEVPGQMDPLVLRVPPTSLKPFKEYYRKVFGQGKTLTDVITHVGLKKASNAAGIAYNQASFEVAK